MIEVFCDQTGDRAEAEDERSALVAARTLLDDAWRATATQGFKPTATFRVAGEIVLTGINEPTVWANLGTERPC